MYHLKLVGRQIFQRKGYFVINTIGLAVALTASILIYTFLVKEWQTNTYHKNVDHIYRITVQTDGYAYWGSEVCSSLGEIAKAELPEVTVPEGHVFAMGDNRQNSIDSRHGDVGCVSIDQVVGKAVLRLYPFDQITLF